MITPNFVSLHEKPSNKQRVYNSIPLFPIQTTSSLTNSGKQDFTKHLTNIQYQQQRINNTIELFSKLVDFHLNLIKQNELTKVNQKLYEQIKQQRELIQNEEKNIDKELLENLLKVFHIKPLNSVFHTSPSFVLQSNLEDFEALIERFQQIYETKVLQLDYDSTQGKTFFELDQLRKKKLLESTEHIDPKEILKSYRLTLIKRSTFEDKLSNVFPQI